jgi:hypothetical protein
MNPCLENKKTLSWLAAGHCDPAEERKLREHFAHCHGCHSYFAEMSGLIGTLAPRENQRDIEPAESFHQTLVERVRVTQADSLRARIAALFPTSIRNWRLLLPALGAAAAVLALSVHLSRPPGTSSDRPVVFAPNPGRLTGSFTPDPSLANYRNAADRSLDDLDALLARQAGAGAGPSAPLYTASTSSLLAKPD